jgi:hypothetical protein
LLDENLISGFTAILQELGYSARNIYHVQHRCLIAKNKQRAHIYRKNVDCQMHLLPRGQLSL